MISRVRNRSALFQFGDLAGAGQNVQRFAQRLLKWRRLAMTSTVEFMIIAAIIRKRHKKKTKVSWLRNALRRSRYIYESGISVRQS